MSKKKKTVQLPDDWNRPTIKMEGGIANPDEFAWECDCAKCQERYAVWKEKFDAQQAQLRGEKK
jgi:hypothetical protein